MKKGFATSAILYTILLLFLVTLVGILNNLQNKKTILEALKKDTVTALENDTVLDALMDQVGIINSEVNQLSASFEEYQNNHKMKTYNCQLGDTKTLGTALDTYYVSIVISENDILRIYEISGGLRAKPTAWESYSIGKCQNWTYGETQLYAYSLNSGAPFIFTIDEGGNASYGMRYQPGEINEWFSGESVNIIR